MKLDDDVLEATAENIWESMQIDGRPDSPPRCCVCDTTENLHKDGWYGYRCDSDGCVCF